MYEAGQGILGGQAVVATIDTDGKILSVEFPLITGNNGPLVVTYNYGVTEAFVANAVGSLH